MILLTNSSFMFDRNEGFCNFCRYEDFRPYIDKVIFSMQHHSNIIYFLSKLFGHLKIWTSSSDYCLFILKDDVFIFENPSMF
jgi:hypothetical protein